MLCPLGEGATMTALPHFNALMMLLAGVAAGLVEGAQFPFSSGYLLRELAQIPKSTEALPWRLNHDYLADCRDFRRNGVDDGQLCFEVPA